jgi:spermidine dehydrogenase
MPELTGRQSRNRRQFTGDDHCLDFFLNTYGGPLSDSNSHSDKTLGMAEPISRRDFLNSTLLASGGILLSSLSPMQLLQAQEDWTGYGGVGDYSNSNGNTWDIVLAGHQIRDGMYDSLPSDVVDTGETYDCVVVGGGISGLAAAVFFQRLGGNGKTCLVLDNHPIFGGEAKRNEFVVDGQHLTAHQGSAFFQVPFPHSFIGRFYESIGLPSPRLEYQKWAGPTPEMPLPTTPYPDTGKTYGFYFGAKFGQKPGMWMTDPWGKQLAGAPLPAQAKSDLLKWHAGDPNFQRPQYEGDEISRHLDSISLEDHIIERFGISRDTIRNYLSPVEGGGSGLGPDAISAYADYGYETLHPMDESDATGNQMFPGGNAGFARLMVKTLIPDAIAGEHSVSAVCRNPVNFALLDRNGSSTRIRLNSTAVWVQHEGPANRSQAVIVAYTNGGKVHRVKARTVVMAGGSWTTKHVVRDLPEAQAAAYDQFYRSPCLMANVAVRNWRFLYKMGISGCRWFEGIGDYLEVRKIATIGSDSPTISADSPVVLTLKILYAHPGLPTATQGHKGRAEMMSTSFREYERRIRQQFSEMFTASGFDARRDIAGIVLNRWGHAYLSPQPGFFFGTAGKPGPREILRATPFGRIAFANSDLTGVMDHRCSIQEAHRAVSQLLDQVLES